LKIRYDLDDNILSQSGFRIQSNLNTHIAWILLSLEKEDIWRTGEYRDKDGAETTKKQLPRQTLLPERQIAA
jgi:hypothetical protein